MSFVRLKCSTDLKQINNRLKYMPELIEIQLVEEDLSTERNIDHLIWTIRMLKERNIKVYLHHPMKYKGLFLDILSTNEELKNYYNWSCLKLAKICKDENVKCVIHAHYSRSESTNLDPEIYTGKMKERIEGIDSFSRGYFLWENTIEGLFSQQNPYLFEKLIKPLKLPLCFDTSHAFISLQGNNEKLKFHLLKELPFIEYLHIVDSLGKTHDSLELGSGLINWETIAHLFVDKDFIFEIGLNDFEDCTEMIRSVEFYKHLIK